MKIKPASNNQLKLWRKLLQGKYRKREGLFLAEGIRCVNQILENGLMDVDAIIIEEGSPDASQIGRGDVPVFSLPPDDFAAISDTENPQGVAAVCRIPDEADPAMPGNTPGLVVAMDAIQDPGNLGTMIRTASWFGAKSLLFGHGTVDPFHPKVVRSTAGATGSIPFMKGELSELLAEFESNGHSIFLLDASEPSVSLKAARPEKKAVIVVGNEANGIDRKLFKAGRTAVKIDGNPGRVESLNAAVALSIALWHFNCR
jgi:RNA methyltransferase, TrmH family